MRKRRKIVKIGCDPVLEKSTRRFDKTEVRYISEPIPIKRVYYNLLRRGYHPLAEQQEWVKRKLDAER